MNSIARGSDTPKPILDAIYRYRAERRVADIAVVLNSSVPDPMAPDNATLEQFYQETSQRYMAPEYRTLTFITLTPDQLLEEVAVAEKRNSRRV